MRLGVPLTSRIAAFALCCCLAVASTPSLAAARGSALTLAEREDISRGIACGSSIREIASRFERTVSTVSREIAAHGGRAAYRAHEADQQTWNAALRPKRCLRMVNRRLRDIVASKLMLDWSPEQISGWLNARYPDDESMRVSAGNHLSQPVSFKHEGVEKRAAGPSALKKRRMRHSRHMLANHWTVSGKDCRCRVDPRKARGGGKTELFPATGKATCWLVERTTRITLRR